LEKAKTLDIAVICPLHGPVLDKDLNYYLDLYKTWSSYGVETEGILINFTSVYGNTLKAVNLLADKLLDYGAPKVVVNDLARSDMAECVEDAFRYGKMVLATTTYNGEIFPFMREFINHLTERGYKNKTIGTIENGSWAPMATKIIKKMFEGSKNITFTENNVSILSAMNEVNEEQIDALARELCEGYEI
ncbi:MAG: FprA family A-type flavoprotein, partial [Lachnospiraceae bacterium]|nr:FprA family A-type flavoprotein [Lachnospiraceae bacterium]